MGSGGCHIPISWKDHSAHASVNTTRIFNLWHCQPVPSHCAFGSGAVGRKVSSSMKSLVWVTGGIPHLCLSPVLPSEHLLQTWRGWGAAAVTHSRSAESNVSLPIFLQARRPSALHPISPAKSRCPACEVTINHYGDCCKVTSLGLVFQLSTKQQVLGSFLESGVFSHCCAVPEGKTRFFPSQLSVGALARCLGGISPHANGGF